MDDSIIQNHSFCFSMIVIVENESYVI